MIRIAATALAATLALSSAATAQEAFDWTGVYGGVSYTLGYEPHVTSPGFADDTTTEDQALGFFGGYQRQFNQFVVGAEVHATLYNDESVLFVGEEMLDIFEARLRGGYAFERVLVSASVGYASQTYSTNLSSAFMEGYTLGVGVDYALPNNLLIGAEYVMRDMDGDVTLSGLNVRTEDETFRIRFGIRF